LTQQYGDSDDDDDDDVFVGIGSLSVGSKLPGTFHRSLDPTVLEAQPLARTKDTLQ
jgi:hypothetical protein